jgi:hypothetical protein
MIFLTRLVLTVLMFLTELAYLLSTIFY